MFVTKDYLESKDGFNWSQYFSEDRNGDFAAKLNINDIYQNVRSFLKEDNVKMGFALYKVLKELLNGENIKAPSILEIGAATGFLTRSLISLYKGNGILVDRNEESNNQFNKLQENEKANIRYIIKDLFELNLNETFDIVCSFGLIEHFVDKKDVVSKHTQFMKPNGKVLIIVPLDTPLSRAYFEINPELNLGYRELMTKKELVQSMENCNLKVLKTINSFGYTYDFIAALGVKP